VNLNGNVLELGDEQTLYVANGRDTRIHTVTLGPYIQYSVPLAATQLQKGDNTLEVTPTHLNAAVKTAIALSEIELIVEYETP